MPQEMSQPQNMWLVVANCAPRGLDSQATFLLVYPTMTKLRKEDRDITSGIM